VNVADAFPDETLTVVGTLAAAESELERFTTVLDPKPASVTVPVTTADDPPTTDPVDSVSDSRGAGSIVSFAVAVFFTSFAVMIATVVVATPLVLIVKDADVA
jgi:hypothetical protein